MGHNIEQGPGDCRLLKFKGFVEFVPILLKLIVCVNENTNKKYQILVESLAAGLWRENIMLTLRSMQFCGGGGGVGDSNLANFQATRVLLIPNCTSKIA